METIGSFTNNRRDYSEFANKTSTDLDEALTEKHTRTMLTIKVKFLIVLVLLAACTSTKKINSNNEIAPIESQTKVMVASIPTARGDKSDLISPRTIENGKLKLVNSHDWTSGFFAG